MKKIIKSLILFKSHLLISLNAIQKEIYESN